MRQRSYIVYGSCAPVVALSDNWNLLLEVSTVIDPGYNFPYEVLEILIVHGLFSRI